MSYQQPWRHFTSGKRFAVINRYTFKRLPTNEIRFYAFEIATQSYRYIGPEPVTAIGAGNVRGA